MQSNFDFLSKYWSTLAKIGSTAESYLYNDPNACIYKIGMFAERLVKEIFAFEQLQEPDFDNSHSNRINILKNEGLIERGSKIDNILFALRKKRNNAVHNFEDSIDDAKAMLKMAYHLAEWFMQLYGDWNYTTPEYILPKKEPDIDYESIIQKQEEEIEKLNRQIKEVKTPVSDRTKIERIKRTSFVSENMDLSEAETRLIIDNQLKKYKWEADTVCIRYSKGSRPQKNKNLAIAEWPVKNGFADYALFAGLRLVGIIEVKKADTDIPSVIDYQCKEYASSVKDEHKEYIIDSWGQYQVPFVFATNGRKYLKQIETKSGIWFLDLRERTNVSKALSGWISPNGIIEMLEKDTSKSDFKLNNMPVDFLRDPDGLNLRDYQIRAIQETENAVMKGAKTALLSMATGTGKTRTVLGMIYRFLKSGRFKRILFLVDRTALGEQAEDVFKEVKIEDLMTLDSIYNIKGLEDKEIDKETKIHIATVQSLVKRIVYGDEIMPSVTEYDLLVIDEAHRGYTLDRELSEDEMLYRSQEDYISKYRTVIEYFDAVKIALTATPALHTTEIFGKPIFTYSYREAVIDGYLADHDAPHDIHTKLRDNGIQYKKGDTLEILDLNTGELLNSDELEDDMDFEIDKFNKQIITENFNRAVFEEIAMDFDPEGDGKTLIFAVNDSHADMIVNILKEIYHRYGLDNDTVLKITGKSGDKKRVSEAIRRFKNEEFPKIVVTVDLLTTGIDVPKIVNLVFMRRMKSRILFEQMLGRATRLCPEINKTHFEIYDPVGVYETLEPVSNMKPVVTNPKTTFTDLINGLEVIEESKKSRQVTAVIAKLQRKAKNIGKKAEAGFIYLNDGNSLSETAKKLKDMDTESAVKYIIEHKEAFQILDDDRTHNKGYVIIDHHEDEIISHERGYGKGNKPQDYIEEFKNFIQTNFNQITALQIVCTKPAELTRESLKQLKMELDRHDFTENKLNTAWNEMTNQEIAADIIAFVRQQAIGSALISHETRVKTAFQKLRQNHKFNKDQLNWLGRIEKIMLKDTILDMQMFEQGALKNAGGFANINKRFNGQLGEMIKELNIYMYDDGGNIA